MRPIGFPTRGQAQVSQSGGLLRRHAEVFNEALHRGVAPLPALHFRKDYNPLFADFAVIGRPQALVHGIADGLSMGVIAPAAPEDFGEFRLDGVSEEISVATGFKVEDEAFLGSCVAPPLEDGSESGTHARPGHRRLNLKFFQDRGALFLVERPRVAADKRQIVQFFEHAPLLRQPRALRA